MIWVKLFRGEMSPRFTPPIIFGYISATPLLLTFSYSIYRKKTQICISVRHYYSSFNHCPDLDISNSPLAAELLYIEKIYININRAANWNQLFKKKKGQEDCGQKCSWFTSINRHLTQHPRPNNPQLPKPSTSTSPLPPNTTPPHNRSSRPLCGWLTTIRGQVLAFGGKCNWVNSKQQSRALWHARSATLNRK